MRTVTITGADDSVDPNDLVRLSQKYPFVEWGILHSTKRCGASRYPSGLWITGLSVLAQKHSLKLAAHLCGSLSNSVSQHAAVASLHPCFNRVQYNGMLPYEVKPLPEVADKYEHILQVPAPGFYSSALSHAASYPATMSVLWDASGGRGQSPDYWMLPTDPNVRWGLAGGLGPGLCSRLRDLGPDWIDMESGVRTNGNFDLTKVEAVLKEVGSTPT